MGGALPRRYAIGLLLACASLAGCGSDAGLNPDAEAYSLYLVRHAEKETGDNPGLTDGGRERAHKLAATSERLRFKRIYTTDYRRTRETAQPSAQILGLDVTLYHPNDLDMLAATLKARKESALIVGHSNTTPQLARLLGLKSAKPMDESDYDRSYNFQFKGDVMQGVTYPAAKADAP